MQDRQLGTSSVKVSPVIFGAWAIGGWMWGGNEESDSIDAIRAAIDHGIHTIDTAAIYGMGHSEELVAKAIEGRRDKVVIATKCGMRWNTEQGSEPWPQKDNDGKDVVIRKNGKADSIAYECEQSLKRLKVEVIDLFQIHWPDRSTPAEETIGAMEKLRQQGKVRAIGTSNYNVEWLTKASATATIASDQPPYSILRRGIEKELLPFCRDHQIGTICYSPMERGLLTGKVGPDRTFGEGDHRAKHPYFSVENRKKVIAALESVKPIADKYGVEYAQLIVNWTFSQPGITAAIVGARNAEQATANAKAMSFTLTGDELAQIRSAFDGLAAELATKK
jgi:aryl-alcohol dehydrogenase-like predicted oxidoreductase